MLVVALALAPDAAAAQAVGPALALGEWPTVGSERVFVDLAVMPQAALRRDFAGNLIPGGFRLGTWANLSSRSFAKDRVRIVTSFRFDLDTAATPAEVNAFRPFLSPTRYALLAAYVEADLMSGLQLRAGRQFHADAADYLAFDGAKLLWRFGRLPLRLELYGGTRSTWGITTGAVASSLYELDGVAETSGVQPMAGTVLRYTGGLLPRSEASIGFRWSWRAPDSDRALDPTLPDALFMNAQELVASAGTDVGPVHLSGALGYEVVLGTVMRARASASIGLDKLLGWAVDPATLEGSTLSLEYRRYRPTFALDSIFNYFSLNPFDEYSAVAGLWVGPRARAELRWFERRFSAETADAAGMGYTASPGNQGARGVRLSGFAAFGVVRADAIAQAQFGYGGRRIVLDGGARLPVREVFEIYARANVTSFADDLRPSQAGTNLGIVAGGTWHLPRGASVSLIVEEAVLLGSAKSGMTAVPRLFGVADLAMWL
jgi:hypothetical protein